MALLNVSIVNVALPPIDVALDAGPNALQWIVAGFTLAFGLVLIPAGRLGDTLGRRRMFLLGLVVFVLASAGCGLAPTSDALVGWRLAQGVGAGILNPQVVGFVQQLFRGEERARAFGMFGATVGIATASGPLLGGILLAVFGEASGWRAVFLVNLPIGLALIPVWRRALDGEPGSLKPPRPDRRPSSQALVLRLRRRRRSPGSSCRCAAGRGGT